VRHHESIFFLGIDLLIQFAAGLQEDSMETRIFDRPTPARSTDGNHVERFNAGERVKNIRRIGKRVMFEPANPYRVAGTYAMEWSEFESSTTAVREAKASI
jgi:hypothetical protein